MRNYCTVEIGLARHTFLVRYILVLCILIGHLTRDRPSDVGSLRTTSASQHNHPVHVYKQSYVSSDHVTSGAPSYYERRNAPRTSNIPIFRDIRILSNVLRKFSTFRLKIQGYERDKTATTRNPFFGVLKNCLSLLVPAFTLETECSLRSQSQLLTRGNPRVFAHSPPQYYLFPARARRFSNNYRVTRANFATTNCHIQLPSMPVSDIPAKL
jgi:hypothetical protein